MSFVFGKVYENCVETKKKCYFTKPTSNRSNINRKPHIWFYYEIIMKFRPKKWGCFILAKVYENCPKIKEKRYFTKLTS